MTYKIQMKGMAAKKLEKLPKNVQIIIRTAIDALAEEPRPYGSIKLKGKTKEGRHRIRVGDYRVVYSIKDKELIVLVIDVGNRRDIYQ